MITAKMLHERYSSLATPYLIAYRSGPIFCYCTHRDWEESIKNSADYEPFDIDVDETYHVAIIDDGDFD